MVTTGTFAIWVLLVLAISVGTVCLLGWLSFKVNIFDDQVEQGQQEKNMTTGRGIYLGLCAIACGLIAFALIYTGGWMATTLVMYWPFQ